MSAWVAFFYTLDSLGPRDWLVVGLVTIWGLRLSIHILIRNWGKGEDFRYVKMREENGPQWWWKSFFKVFLLQGLLMWIVSAPLTAVQNPAAQDTLGLFDFLALALWLFGFYFEAFGDAQLTRFKANPENKGKVLQTGVWRYTRHPNYFGDSAQWWSYYLLALAAGGWCDDFQSDPHDPCSWYESQESRCWKKHSQKPNRDMKIMSTGPALSYPGFQNQRRIK